MEGSRRKALIRYIGALALALPLFLSLAACGGGGNGNGGDDADALRGDALISMENYIYLAEFSSMPHVTARVRGAITHENRIYFYYVEESEFPDGYAEEESLRPLLSTIVIEAMLPDGETVSRTEIPHVGGLLDIAGFRVTEAGNFALIFTDSQWAERGSDTLLLYAEYSPQGAELYRREMREFVPEDASWFSLRQALFMDDGGVAMVVGSASGGAAFTSVKLLDAQFSLRGQLPAHRFPLASAPLAQTRDGRLFMLDEEDCPEWILRPILREIDRETGTWAGTFPTDTIDWLYSLHPAREDSFFDLYITTERELLGYKLETGEKTPLLNWIESRVLFARGASHLNVLEDGRLSVLNGRLLDEEADDWQTEHIVLTRTAKADLPEREIITLGGLFIPDTVRGEVMEFNQRSLTHQIQFETRSLPWDIQGEEWVAANARFVMEILTGQGPDIIYLQPWRFGNLIRSEQTLDLYPFIDGDPDLCRSDFFPHILGLLEAGDGRLPVLGYSFSISSLIGIRDTEGQESWTFDEMRALVEQALDGNMPHIVTNSMGTEMNAETFLRSVLFYSGERFLDFEESRADLDNEDFIALLELVARLPHEDFAWMSRPIESLGARTRDGEQLLHDAFIWGINAYQRYRMAFGDDMVFLGWPAEDGGRHAAGFYEALAINAASAHPEAAWELLRMFLLPGAEFEGRFSLRTDALDDIITDATSPRFELDPQGNEVEVPRTSCPVNAAVPIPLYALTEAEAREFRSLIEGTSVGGNSVEIIELIIAEELPPFLAGDRSAADTARIMQNRVQTFLYEQR